MKKQEINPSTISTYKTIKKIRNDFGNLNPVTRRINNRKRDYQYPDSYYDYDTQEKIEDTIDLNEWGEW